VLRQEEKKKKTKMEETQQTEVKEILQPAVSETQKTEHFFQNLVSIFKKHRNANQNESGDPEVAAFNILSVVTGMREGMIYTIREDQPDGSSSQSMNQELYQKIVECLKAQGAEVTCSMHIDCTHFSVEAKDNNLEQELLQQVARQPMLEEEQDPIAIIFEFKYSNGKKLFTRSCTAKYNTLVYIKVQMELKNALDRLAHIVKSHVSLVITIL
jgi:hypothetical protein